jgi:hypothetical protein
VFSSTPPQAILFDRGVYPKCPQSDVGDSVKPTAADRVIDLFQTAQPNPPVEAMLEHVKNKR